MSPLKIYDYCFVVFLDKNSIVIFKMGFKIEIFPVKVINYSKNLRYLLFEMLIKKERKENIVLSCFNY